ncbi:DUF6212 domain-containing protein [Algicella marina]|uniref:Glycosyltransferase n=1 Tax=Algicella marina TaxID=2683284 RepID=A0A6P1T5A7_9RHOB|nr:DUF6212 domain-containing protein [Algicella marina]QHQ36459.1 glycosyltransferase [Algicella marina]
MKLEDFPDTGRDRQIRATPAPYAIYFDWQLNLRAGGPPGYLANLAAGLEESGLAAQVDLITRNPGDTSRTPRKPFAPEARPLFSSHTRRREDAAPEGEAATARAHRQAAFAARTDWMHIPPANLRRLDPQARHIIHAHTTTDILKLHNTLTRHGCRHTVRLALTSHCPEIPAKEWSEKLYSEGASAAAAELHFRNHRFLDHLAFHHSDILIFPCAEAMEPYRSTFSDFARCFGQRDTRFVPTGATPPKLATPREAVRAAHALGDTFTACYIGRHNAAKGYDILARAGAALLAKEEDLAFLIGGHPGPLAAPGHPRWIEHGWTETPGDLVAAADVFVLPNRQTYFDLMLLEVLAIGIPVLAARNGGNRFFEGLSPGIMLYDSEAELAEGLRHLRALPAEQRVSLGAANRELYEQRFTPAQFARAYTETLNAIATDYPAANGTGKLSAITRNRRPKVSVIVPVYNVERYLEDCLASIAAQTLADIEVLLVNDGSTDGSTAIIDSFVAQDSRFHRVDRANGGLSAARNTGLDAATGAFIAFVDSDDTIAPTMLQDMFQACEATGLKLAACGVQHMDASGTPAEAVAGFIEDQIVYPKWMDGTIVCTPETLTAIYPSAWNKLYHRSVFDGLRYDPGLYYEDHPVFYKAFLGQQRFAFVNAPLYRHRASASGRITQDGSRRALDIFTILDLIESIFRAHLSSREDLKRLMARLVLRLVWERLFTVKDPRTRFRLAEQAVMRFAALEVTQDDVIRYKDRIIEPAFVETLFACAEEGQWQQPEKALAPLEQRINLRDATPDPVPRKHRMVRLKEDQGFILVHPQTGRTTTAEITGLGFFGAAEIAMSLSVENPKSADIAFRARVAPSPVVDGSRLLREGDPVWLAETDWQTVAPLTQEPCTVFVPVGTPTLALYIQTRLEDGASMHNAWARVRDIRVTPVRGPEAKAGE